MTMLAEQTRHAVSTSDRALLSQVSESLKMEPDIAYVVVFDAQRKPLLRHAFGEAVVPPFAGVPPRATRVVRTMQEVEGHRYLELTAPITADGPSHASSSSDPPAATDAPLGYVRLGMNLDRSQAQLRDNLIGAVSVT